MSPYLPDIFLFTTTAISLCCSTIQTTKHTELAILVCEANYLHEGVLPTVISNRIVLPGVYVVREIHCVHGDRSRFPNQTEAVFHDRWIFNFSPTSNISTEAIEVFARDDHLDYVHLDFTELTDLHLKTLSDSGNITLLGISGTRCTDAGMKHIEKYERLERLYVCEMRITDTGAAHIAKCRSLKYVNIYETSIGPKGLDKLFELPNLETLVVTDKKEFKATIAKWKQKRPKVKVVEFEAANDGEGNPRVKE